MTAAQAAGYDVLLTTDKNIRYQQNLSKRKNAIVVIGEQQWPRLRPYASKVVDAVNSATSGGYAEVDILRPQSSLPEREN